MRYLLLASLIAGTLLGGFLMYRDAESHYKKFVVKEDLHRLTVVVIRYFRQKKPPLGEAFWKEIERKEPLPDPWGTPYKLEAGDREREYVWRSAGPDRNYNTRDDITFALPLDSHALPDLTKPEYDLPPGMRVKAAE